LRRLEINKEGKSKKIVQAKRKYVPADLSQIRKKHDDAVRRAQENFNKSVGVIKDLQRQLNLEKNDENAIRNEMSKQLKKRSLFGKKPDVEHLKNKLEESDKQKKKIMQKMLKAKVNLNMSKNHLLAQKASRM
jgi:hypothetical protein